MSKGTEENVRGWGDVPEILPKPRRVKTFRCLSRQKVMVPSPQVSLKIKATLNRKYKELPQHSDFPCAFWNIKHSTLSCWYQKCASSRPTEQASSTVPGQGRRAKALQARLRGWALGGRQRARGLWAGSWPNEHWLTGFGPGFSKEMIKKSQILSDSKPQFSSYL